MLAERRKPSGEYRINAAKPEGSRPTATNVLDPLRQLKELARFADVALQKYCSLIVDEDRVWVCTGNGTQILFRIDSKGITEIGRFQPLDEAGEIFSHPAICNGVLYLRGPTWLDAYAIGVDNDVNGTATTGKSE